MRGSSSKSGRVVIDITPEQKQAIYAELKARGGITMREWFLSKAQQDGLLSASSPHDDSDKEVL